MNKTPENTQSGSRPTTLEQACYQGVSKYAGIGCLVAAMINIVLNMDVRVTSTAFLIGILYLGLYWHSVRSHEFKPLYVPFVGIGVVVLIAIWFLNGGLSGTAPIASLVGVVVVVSALGRKSRLVLAGVIVPLVTVFYACEYFWPESIRYYSNRTEQISDHLLSMYLATFLVAQILLMILKAYHDERERVELANRRLQDSLDELQQMNDNLADALEEVKQLSGLLPICASCNKVRNDEGYWNRIEEYIEARSEATFSHGICPDCAKRLYPELDLEKELE